MKVFRRVAAWTLIKKKHFFPRVILLCLSSSALKKYPCLAYALVVDPLSDVQCCR
jgi:hypothetical protein